MSACFVWFCVYCSSQGVLTHYLDRGYMTLRDSVTVVFDEEDSRYYPVSPPLEEEYAVHVWSCKNE